MLTPALLLNGVRVISLFNNFYTIYMFISELYQNMLLYAWKKQKYSQDTN